MNYSFFPPYFSCCQLNLRSIWNFVFATAQYTVLKLPLLNGWSLKKYSQIRINVFLFIKSIWNESYESMEYFQYEFDHLFELSIKRLVYLDEKELLISNLIIRKSYAKQLSNNWNNLDIILFYMSEFIEWME